MRPLKLHIVLFPLAIPFIGGCAVHSVNQAPAPVFDIPAAYSMGVEEGPAIDGPWWRNFEDSTLDALVEQALAENLTLRQGLTRIDAAIALLRQARAVRLPRADFDANLERSRRHDVGSRPDLDDTSTLEDATNALGAAAGLAETLGSLADGSLGDSFSGIPSGGGLSEENFERDSYDTDFDTGLTVSWEADLWGRLRSAEFAHGEQLNALYHDYEALRLSRSAEVVTTYYLIVEQRLQYELLMEQRELAQTLLELLELRFLQGDASGVDLLQQRSQLAEIDSEVPVVLSQLGLLENRLDVLLGAPPDGVNRVETWKGTLPGNTRLPAIDVPLALLQRRPDLMARQRLVVASDHEIASAIAEQLPRITLDGSLLFSDNSGGSFLTGLGSAALFQPLLDWGLRKAQVEVARADFEESLLAFSQSYLLAIEEVETALWREKHQRDLIDALATREDILARTVEETRVRYSLGVTDYLPVLTALQNLQNVQRSLLEERRELVDLRILLYKAVGGATRTHGKDAPLELTHNADDSMRQFSLNQETKASIKSGQ